MPQIVKPSRGPELESDILRECRKWLAAQPDIAIHRNNTGVAHVSSQDFIRSGLDPVSANAAYACVRAKFHGMHFGLAIGSSDLIGSITVDIVTLDGSHRRIARFLAIELKQPGNRPTEDQERFLEAKRKIGGVAFWADNLATVQDMIGRARRWEI